MKDLPKVIYIMGAPGSGKGTQAEMLSQTLGYHRFSTGSAFRETAQQPTDLGRQVKNLIDNGFLAPPELAAQIVIEAIKKHVTAGAGLVFDGTPRTLEEAALVDEFFAKNNYGRPLAILLDVPQEEMIKRNSKRRFCLGIKSDFPVITEEDAAKCTAQGGTVGMRPDDDPAKFATRWDEFKKRTYPVVENYEQTGILKRVDGQGTIEDVHAAVMNVIQAYNAA